MKRFFYALAAASLVFTGCTEEDNTPAPASLKLVSDSQVTVSNDGGYVNILYRIQNPVEGGVVSAESNAQWLTVVDASKSGRVSLKAEMNPRHARTAAVTLKYSDLAPLTVTFNQLLRLGFDIDVTDIEPNDAAVSLRPDDKNLKYYYTSLTAEMGEQYAGNYAHLAELIVKQRMETLGKHFSSVLSKGDVTSSFAALSSGSDYYVIAFGCEDDGTITTDPTVVKFTTPKFVPSENCTFDLSIDNVWATTFDINVKPSDAATRYYVGICDASYLQEYTPEQIALLFIANENASKIDWAGNSYIHTGNTTTNPAVLGYGSLNAQSSYAVAVFGVSKNGRRTTETTIKTVTTTEVPKSNLKLEMEVSDITSTGVTITCTPSNDNETYFVDVIDAGSYANNYNAPIEFLERQFAVMKEYGILDWMLKQGKTVMTDYQSGLDPDTVHYAIGCGYNGGITTDPFMIEFKTLPAAATSVASTGTPALDSAQGLGYGIRMLDSGLKSGNRPVRSTIFADNL